MNPIPPETKARILKVRALLMDVDGVLTDGRIIYGDHGDELKCFNVNDGYGLMLLRLMGFKTAMISAKKSRVNQRRAKETGVLKLYQNVKDKGRAFDKAARAFKCAASEVCYVGDDWPDIPAMRKAGFAVAVASAAPEVRHAAHFVTQAEGGRGAVRELCELLLETQGLAAAALERAVP